jgi:oligopeptide transport system substrate-binding protein
VSAGTRKGRRAIPALAAAALAVIVVVAAVACGGIEDGGTGPSGTPELGGAMTLAYFSEPSSLDPAVGWNVIDCQIEHDIYQGLLRYAAAPGLAGTRLVPCLATEVPSVANGGVSSNGRTYTFHLRSGVAFQPPLNREVTARDFKYSVERMMLTRRAPAKAFYTGIAGARRFIRGEATQITGIRVLDPATVRVTLKQPDPAFLNAIAMDFCDVVPKEWVEKWGPRFGEHPLGTGPFVFESWTPGREIVLKRNPTYWETGRPYLDALDYQLSYPPSTAVAKVQHGEVDALGDGVPPADLERVRADPSWSQYVHTQPLVAVAYLWMNVRMNPFDDVRVRRALSWAIDRKALVRLLDGEARALWQFYPVGLPGHREGERFYGYDPAKARALLRAAGFPHGFATTLSLDDVDPNPRLMKAVKSDLAAVGVRARLQTMSNEALYERQSTPKTLPLGDFQWWMDFPDPNDWVLPLFSRAGARRGGMNSSFWWSPRLEAMLEKARATTDPRQRIRRFSAMQPVIAAAAPYVTLYQPVQTTMCSMDTGGFFLHPVYLIDPTQYWKN